MVKMNDGWQEEVSRMAFEATSKRLQPVLDQILDARPPGGRCEQLRRRVTSAPITPGF
jgi:hypothetical protein